MHEYTASIAGDTPICMLGEGINNRIEVGCSHGFVGNF